MASDAMYMRIADDLRVKIKSGELSPGDQLKPEAGLQREYSLRPDFTSNNVSRNTVRDAIDLLAREGLVEKRPGQGTFVVTKVEPFLTTLSGNPEGGESSSYQSEVSRRGRRREETPPRVEIMASTQAPELLLSEDEQVISRHQQRYIDGRPYSLQTSFYPMSYAAAGAPRLLSAGEIEEGAVAYIKATLGIKQAGWQDEIHVRTSSTAENEFFDLSAKNNPKVTVVSRTAFDGNGRPIRLTVTIYAADRNRLAYKTGVVPPEPPEATPPDAAAASGAVSTGRSIGANSASW